MQYALRERAVALGWHAHDVDVVDTDLGRSGATTEGRSGVQDLVARIALSEVGILLAFDATRLAHNCSHWYQLLELCGKTDCLIGDRDGVYDPTSINCQLLLGLKGQISELELHTIRARLTAGIFSKASRGELELALPTGLERLEGGVVVKHRNIEVQQRIDLVFATFFERKSVSQTVRWFIQNDLTLPRHDRGGEIQWKRATAASLSGILNNPAYAGAAAYGRTRWKKSENTAKNAWNQPASTAVALLHGITYCGGCGHEMCVQYKGGTQYLCNHLKQQTGAKVCQRIGGDAIDNQVVAWFFEALSVAEIDVTAQALQTTDTEHASVLAARRQQVDRLRYQTQLAERQFMKSDPHNRLVTGELERRWETHLRELKAAEEQYEKEQRHTPQYAITTQLFVARDRTNQRVLTDKAAAPVNGDIDMFTLALHIHNHTVNEMADNGLTISSGGAGCIPQNRQVVRQLLDHVQLVRLQLDGLRVFETTQIFFDLSLRLHRLFPESFQLAGDQTVLRLHRVILSSCPVHFELRSLQPVTPQFRQPPPFLFRLLHGLHAEFHRGWL